MRQRTRHKTGYVGGRGQSSSSRPSPDILRERQISTVTGYMSSKYLSLKDPRLLLSYPPWMRRIIWFNLLTVTLTPLFSLYGILSTPLNTMTLFFSVTYYIWNMIGAQARDFVQLHRYSYDILTLTLYSP